MYMHIHITYVYVYVYILSFHNTYLFTYSLTTYCCLLMSNYYMQTLFRHREDHVSKAENFNRVYILLGGTGNLRESQIIFSNER